MITDNHRAYLNAAAITDEVIELVGVESTDRGINFPWRSPDGTVVTQFRPDDPGDGPKYQWPADTPLILNQVRDDGFGPILLVEGTKQTLAAASWAPPEYSIIGMAGCWGWSKCDLSFTSGREVIAVFDGDVASNRHVWDAASRLKDMIEGEGGTVRLFTIPGNPNDREGLDDVLARRDAADRSPWIRRRCLQAGPRLPKKPPAGSGSPYFDQQGLKVKVLSKDLYESCPMLLSQERKPAIYDKGAFRMDGTAFTGAVAKTLGDLYRPYHRAAAEEFITGMLYSEGRMLPERMTEPLLNCANGMLDLTSGKLYPHDPKYGSSVQVPVEWDEDACAPVYEGWLTEYAGVEQMDDLEEVASTMLDPSRTPTKAIFLYGKSRSGKSTFLRLMKEIAGSDNVSAVTLHQLSDDRFAAADVYGKMLNAAADLSSQHVEDLSTFKMLTGEDLIRGNRKYGGTFAFTNTALFAFSANDLPTVGESSRAYSERIKPFAFNNSFAGRENPAIEAKMKEELSGILRRWVKAWQRMNARGHFQATSAAVKHEFEIRSDRVRQWVFERCTINTTTADGVTITPGMTVQVSLTTGKRDAARAFNQWATEVVSGGSSMGERKIVDRLLTIPGVMEVRRSDTKNVVLNITVKPMGEADNPNPFEVPERDETENVSDAQVCVSHTGVTFGVAFEDEKTAPDQARVRSVGTEPTKTHKDFLQAKKAYGEGDLKVTPRTPDHPEGSSSMTTTPPLTCGNAADEAQNDQVWLSDSKVTPEAPKATPGALKVTPAPLQPHQTHTNPTLKSCTTFDLETASAEEMYRRRDFVRLGAYAEGLGLAHQTTNGHEIARAVSSARFLVGHNICAFDLQALGRWHGLDLAALKDKVVDLDLWLRCVDPPMSGKDGSTKMAPGYYSLDQAAARYGVSGKTHDLKALAKKHGGLDQIPTDDPEYRRYLDGDIEATRGLLAALLPTWNDYIAREMNVGLITAQMSLNGFRVDVEELTRTLAEQAERKERNLEELAALTGMPLDAKSPLATKAGKEAIEEALTEAGIRGDALPRTGKTGALSTSREEMGELLGKVRKFGGNERVERIISLIMDVVGERTVFQTIENSRIEDRVHPTIRPLQASGRWSVTGPGLTVFGKRGGKHVERRVLLPERGHVLLAFDLDQVDARAVAAHSQDAGYMRIFQDGLDLHAENAKVAFGDPKRREDAKPIGHGWNYGMSARAMEAQGVSFELAVQFDKQMRKAYPRLVEWQNEVRAKASAGELLDNGWGRLMRPDPKFAYTQAPALVGQGATRDILAEGLLRMPPEIWPMLRVLIHDEMVLSVPQDIAEDVSRTVIEAMSFEFRGVPITAGVSKPGLNWAQVYDK